MSIISDKRSVSSEDMLSEIHKIQQKDIVDSQNSPVVTTLSLLLPKKLISICLLWSLDKRVIVIQAY